MPDQQTQPLTLTRADALEWIPNADLRALARHFIDGDKDMAPSFRVELEGACEQLRESPSPGARGRLIKALLEATEPEAPVGLARRAPVRQVREGLHDLAQRVQDELKARSDLDALLEEVLATLSLPPNQASPIRRLSERWLGLDDDGILGHWKGRLRRIRCG